MHLRARSIHNPSDFFYENSFTKIVYCPALNHNLTSIPARSRKNVTSPISPQAAQNLRILCRVYAASSRRGSFARIEITWKKLATCPT
jgi:hypothetical protein